MKGQPHRRSLATKPEALAGRPAHFAVALVDVNALAQENLRAAAPMGEEKVVWMAALSVYICLSEAGIVKEEAGPPR